VAELGEAVAFAKARSLPFFVLGGGSNVLVGDGEFPGLVIHMCVAGIRETCEGDVVRLEVGAGESWETFVRICVERGYWGVENLSLIPGTVGASPVQNIGAYGGEVKDVIESVSVIDAVSGASLTLGADECAFAYRDSIFKKTQGKNFIITYVTFRLSKVPSPNLSYKDLAERFSANPNPTLAQIREAVISIRTSKFPDLSLLGTAGSFWKNPVISTSEFDALKAAYPLIPSYSAGKGMVKIPLAWILDVVCGLKGYAKGPVHLFKNQPLVLTAERTATATEVHAFADEIEAVVRSKTGIIIEREVNSLLC
jgi:UDP-N-acetylmuramate dehydrogenase